MSTKNEQVAKKQVTAELAVGVIAIDVVLLITQFNSFVQLIKNLISNGELDAGRGMLLISVLATAFFASIALSRGEKKKDYLPPDKPRW